MTSVSIQVIQSGSFYGSAIKAANSSLLKNPGLVTPYLEKNLNNLIKPAKIEKDMVLVVLIP
jgi:hypothetical protein